MIFDISEVLVCITFFLIQSFSRQGRPGPLALMSCVSKRWNSVCASELVNELLASAPEASLWCLEAADTITFDRHHRMLDCLKESRGLLFSETCELFAKCSDIPSTVSVVRGLLVPKDLTNESRDAITALLVRTLLATDPGAASAMKQFTEYYRTSNNRFWLVRCLWDVGRPVYLNKSVGLYCALRNFLLDLHEVASLGKTPGALSIAEMFPILFFIKLALIDDLLMPDTLTWPYEMLSGQIRDFALKGKLAVSQYIVQQLDQVILSEGHSITYYCLYAPIAYAVVCEGHGFLQFLRDSGAECLDSSSLPDADMSFDGSVRQYIERPDQKVPVEVWEMCCDDVTMSVPQLPARWGFSLENFQANIREAIRSCKDNEKRQLLEQWLEKVTLHY